MDNSLTLSTFLVPLILNIDQNVTSARAKTTIYEEFLRQLDESGHIDLVDAETLHAARGLVDEYDTAYARVFDDSDDGV